MGLDTNPGYREGTVPVTRTPLTSDLVELGADLEGVLGQVGATSVFEAILTQASPGEVEVLPTPGCADFLTYR